MKFLQFFHKGEVYTIVLDKADYYKYHGCQLRYYSYGGVCVMVEDKAVSLHRLIAGAGPKDIVRFIDGDKFNLTRENLKVGKYTSADYSRKRDPTTKTYSKYRGVYKRVYTTGRPDSWYVQVAGIKSAGFTSEEEAARYADKLAKKYYGAEAILNFEEDK